MGKCKRMLAFVLAILLVVALMPPIAGASEAEGYFVLEPLNAPPTVNAQAAIVIDYETGEVLWGRDIDTRRDPASMTKNMTAFLVYEEIAAGRLSFDTMIPVSQNAARASRQWDWGGRYINAGEHHSVETMLRLIMLPSHNGACVAMAEYISGSEAAFVRLMNETAERLGVSAHFINSHGAAAGNRVSSYGMATLVRTFVQTHPDILRITSMNSSPFRAGSMPNTNLLLPGGGFFTAGADGFKTGTTPAAGHCLSATATRDGRRVITVIMNAPNDSGRYQGTRNLFNFGFEELARREHAYRSLTAEVTADVYEVRRNTYITATAQIGNIASSTRMLQGARWVINGQTVEEMDAIALQEQNSFTITHAIAADSTAEAVQILFAFTLPFGGEIYDRLILPVSVQTPALFRDIHDHWAEREIEEAVALGLFSGIDALWFAPDEGMSRAMFITVLGRMARAMELETEHGGETPFVDVPAGAWFSDYIAWAYEREIVQGIAADLFGVNQLVTRQEAATFLFRFMQRYDIQLVGDYTLDAPDVDLLAYWATEAMAEMIRTGILRGRDAGYLAPWAENLRAEAVVIFLRMLQAERVAGET